MTLDEQVARWRGFVGRRPAMLAEDLEEMESHLRDQIADLSAAGLSEDEAFLIAVRRMGSVDEISREFALAHSDRLWKQLVVGDGAEVRGRRDLVMALGCAVGAALSLRLCLGLLDDQRLLLNGPLAVLSFLGLYWAIQRRVGARVGAAMAGCLAAVAVPLNVYPFEDRGSTVALAALHAPVLLWLAIGAGYVRGRWRSSAQRMDFLRFTGEWAVYYALLALGGGVLMALTVLVFTAIGIDVEVAVAEWILPMGAAGAVVVAAWLVEAKQSVIENIAPVLTRVFSPLTVLLLIAVLIAFGLGGGFVEVDRDLLIAMTAILLLVVGLWLYAVSARDAGAAPGLFDAVLLALIGSALAVDALVLSSMLARIAEFGTSPNKVAALGLNLVLLVNLAWSAWLSLEFLRGRRPFSALERWQTDYLPVYAIWAGVVALGLPVMFGFG